MQRKIGDDYPHNQDVGKEQRTSLIGIELMHSFEQFRPFAYPDPYSPLARKYPNKKWGLVSMLTVLNTIPEHDRTLNPDPITIGWGSTRYANNKRVDAGDKISRNEADMLFDVTLPKYELMVKGQVKRALLWHEFDSLVSFAYNAGTSYKAGDVWRPYNLWENVNKGLNGADMAKYWQGLAITANGIKSNGLIRRRKAESNLYLTGELIT